LERRLLRRAGGLARIVARTAAHLVPAPLAGPVGILRFVMREGAGGTERERGCERKCADRMSQKHHSPPGAGVADSDRAPATAPRYASTGRAVSTRVRALGSIASAGDSVDADRCRARRSRWNTRPKKKPHRQPAEGLGWG